MIKVTIWDTNKHLGVVVAGSNHQRHQTKLITIPIPQVTIVEWSSGALR